MEFKIKFGSLVSLNRNSTLDKVWIILFSKGAIIVEAPWIIKVQRQLSFTVKTVRGFKTLNLYEILKLCEGDRPSQRITACELIFMRQNWVHNLATT